MNCRFCGNPLSENARFCRRCGKPVHGVDPFTAPTERKYEPEPVKRPASKPEPKPAPAKNKKWKDIYTVLIIVGIIVIGPVIWLIAKNSGEPAVLPEPTYTNWPTSDTPEEENVDVPLDENAVGEVEEDIDISEDVTIIDRPAEIPEEIPEEEPEIGEINVDVENVVLAHREKYNAIVSDLNNGYLDEVSLSDGITAYTDGSVLKAVYVQKGALGDEYRKFFYYDDQGYVFFAYYEGKASHRFYLIGDQLIRWRYAHNASDSQNATNHDMENDNIFYNWRDDVVSEAHYVKDQYMDMINPNLYAMSDISYAGASSVLSEADVIHKPNRAFDGDLSTAWVEGASGYGVGEELTVAFGKNYTISGMTIYAGYQKNEDIYYKNSRPKDITVMFGDFSVESFTLQDYLGVQHIEFSSPKDTSSVTIIIDSVYPGNKYEDTVISDIYYETKVH